MKIQSLFKRDIHRPINGVVKADQLDASSVWQELDEFVVTKELTRHIDSLVEVVLASMDAGVHSSGMNGVWISGFFGSGKSHFLKVFSYLLENKAHSFEGTTRNAVDFFEDKLSSMAFADLKRATTVTTDTILFNIDSKADHQEGRDALLQVFLRVLNEKQGYSPDHAHVAHMERYLDEKGHLARFHEVFERESGASWIAERDAYEFQRDAVVKALSEATGQSEDSAEKWVDGAEDNFSLTVENFAKWVKQFLDTKGPSHRLMFLVDEVGQFIGNNTHLMLNLQTITEQLGTVCAGRAWVVVTSQEDLDAVLGDLKHGKTHDFSKIQGRFKTRLSLSSSNVDEVIKRRILEKSDQAASPLMGAYEGKHDLLKNQLDFSNAGMSFRAYEDGNDFAGCYPFAAYQFTLVQKVFESIRKAGATGLHLSQGERSTLEAFQGAAKELADEEVGALVPFWMFYPAVEGFLDTAVKRTIDQASEHHVLEPFDATVLKLLFLIRYIDELPGNVDNLVTLCVDKIDAARMSIRRQVEESLGRLESETLISRNGELYAFLTNEERDIGREIKNTEIGSGAEERELGRMLFEDVLGDLKKHTYTQTKRDFSFSRLCDDHVIGSKIEEGLEVYVVSPLGERYGEFASEQACVMHTTHEAARVLIVLPDDKELGRELRTFIQTQKYVKTRKTNALPESTQKILRDRTAENRTRERRLVTLLQTMVLQAQFYASGSLQEVTGGDPKVALGNALEYLITNAYPKMSYIETLHPNPKQAIQSMLRADDIDQMAVQLEETGANPKALEEVREYLKLAGLQHHRVMVHDLIHKRFGGRPYGWLDLEAALLVARLAVLKEITLTVDAHPLAMDQVYDYLVSPNKQKKVQIAKRKAAGSEQLKKAQAVAKQLFGSNPPKAQEQALFELIKGELTGWYTTLTGYQTLASNSDYPGLEDIENCLAGLKKFVGEEDSTKLIERFVENERDLEDLQADFVDLKQFHDTQRHSWGSLGEGLQRLSVNRQQLEADPNASAALRQLEEIKRMARPYGRLHEVAGLLHTATEVNKGLLQACRPPVVAELNGLLEGIQREIAKHPAAAALEEKATKPLKALVDSVGAHESIAHIHQARQTGEAAFDAAMRLIEEALTTSGLEGGDGDPPDGGEGGVTGPKPHEVVQVKGLWEAAFLENEEDVRSFTEALRTRLEAIIQSGKRVRLK